MPVRQIGSGSLTAATEGRSWPRLVNAAAHDIVFSASPAAVGSPVTAVPTSVGNTVTVVNPPTLGKSPAGFVFGDFDGVDDQIRLSPTPALGLTNFTAIVVGRFKAISGTQTLFYGMPPGGDRMDLSIMSGTLTYVGNGSSTATATHTWTPDTNWHIFTIVRASGAITIGVDGVEQSTTVTSPESFSSFNIGQKRGGGFASVSVARASIFSSALSGAARVNERANLAPYYGVTL